jgi:surface protein
MKIYPYARLAFFAFVLSLVFTSCTENESPQPSIKKEKISGFVQKGPFVSGTNVLMNELTGTFAQTGKVFTSQISNDRGEFEFTNITLNSRYVEFTSTGFYFNEVECKISSAPITLTSLSDIKDKNSITVNVLTHLQKKRLEFLITNRKSFSEANAQSQAELLAAFKMVLENTTDFDNFNIADNTNEGGMLLAISIILQGNRSVGELTELLSKIQSDFATDGKIDDKSILNALIASTANLDYEAVRVCIENRFRQLNIGTPVPDFKKHIIRFLNLKNLNIIVEGAGRVDQKIISFPSGKEYPQGTTVELTAIPNEGWEFESWAGDLTGSESPVTITVDAEKNITAKFKRRNYPLNITITGEGTVTKNVTFNPVTELPADGTYPFETVIELTAVPDEGSVFERWEGALIGNDATKTITINGEKNVTAVFRKPIFRLAENGVTCVCENVKPGEKGLINGVEFEAVDNQLLALRRDQNADLTKVCTSLVTRLEACFQGRNFNQEIGNWDVSNVTSMRSMFENSTFNRPIEHWNVSKVTTMESMFAASSFNQPIGRWDVSNVTNMAAMFYATYFNQPLNDWDVSNVRIIYMMFHQASFNQPLNDWNVSNVTSTYGMFWRNYSFNQPLSNWDVSNVTIMSSMFQESAFNQPIGNWNVSNVTSMERTFAGTPFNQDISNWNVSKVTTMEGMFQGSSFNKPIGNWDVSNVAKMGAMFYATNFNQPLNQWDVSNVYSMFWMFHQATFNQPIGDWDVSNVTDMSGMFWRNQAFNQPLSKWDVSNVASMASMFQEAITFNQDLSKWCVSNLDTKPKDFDLGATNWVLPQPVWGTCPE